MLCDIVETTGPDGEGVVKVIAESLDFAEACGECDMYRAIFGPMNFAVVKHGSRIPCPYDAQGKETA